METWQKIAIVVAVFGVVIGNLALLKHAAKMDFKKSDKHALKTKESESEDKKSPEE